MPVTQRIVEVPQLYTHEVLVLLLQMLQSPSHFRIDAFLQALLPGVLFIA